MTETFEVITLIFRDWRWLDIETWTRVGKIREDRHQSQLVPTSYCFQGHFLPWSLSCGFQKRLREQNQETWLALRTWLPDTPWILYYVMRTKQMILFDGATHTSLLVCSVGLLELISFAKKISHLALNKNSEVPLVFQETYFSLLYNPVRLSCLWQFEDLGGIFWSLFTIYLHLTFCSNFMNLGNPLIIQTD